MFEKFYPNEYLKSSYDVNYEWLAKHGYQGVIFDIDNTLVPHGAPATTEAIALFARIHQAGLSTCLISNNKAPRVEPFAHAVDSMFISNAHKPSVKGYQEACRRMGTDVEHTVFVGDQLFTDVWGAKRAAIKSILVHPIHPKEEIQIVLKRYLERIVLAFYRRGGQARVSGIFPRK